MSRVDDFCQRIGLTDQVRRWLARNESSGLRREIVELLDAAIQTEDFQGRLADLLRERIAQVRC